MSSIVKSLILIGITLYIAIIYRSTAIAALGFVEAFFVVLALVVLLYRSRMLAFQVRIPIAATEKGKNTTVQIHVENRSRLTVGKLKFRVEAGCRMETRKKGKWLFAGAALPGKNCYPYGITIENAGSYEIRLRYVRIYDLTGMFYIRKKVDSFGTVQVLPEIAEVGVRLSETTRNFFGDADVYDELRPGHDSSEMFRIRNFQNGDRIQSIHWKLSAKLDELMVRENSLPKACPVVFFLDYHHRKKADVRAASVFLQAAGSISFSLMDAGCPHYLCWFSGQRGDVVRIRVEDEESYYQFLMYYLEDGSELPDGALWMRYQDKYRGDRYLYALSLDERLILQKNREIIAKLHPNRWKEDLSRMELIL